MISEVIWRSSPYRPGSHRSPLLRSGALSFDRMMIGLAKNVSDLDD